MAENGDKRTQPDDESLPEVEAELVSETAPSSDAFEDDTPADSPAADADAGDAAEDAVTKNSAAPKRKSTLTPGVMLFLAFAAVALIIFGVWRMQPHPSAVTAPDNATTQAAPVAQEPAPAKSDPPAQAPIKETEISPAPQAKITNAPADDLKTAPVDAAAGEAGYLPPVTQRAAAKISNSVEDGAKEAMRRFREQEGEVSDTDPNESLDPETAATTGGDAPISQAPSEAAAVIEAAPGISPGAADAGASDADALTPEATVPAPAPVIEAANETDNIVAEDQSAALAEAAARLSALERGFETERAQLQAQLAEERRRNADQTAEITQLRAALDEASRRDQAAAAEISDLRANLDKIRNEDVKTSARQMKAAFALAALSRAVDQGGSYTEELAAVTEAIPEAQAMLGAHAETGIASEAVLRERFDGAARAALSAAAQEKAGSGVAGVIARAQSIISVRPAAPAAGDEPGEILSRADHALKQGEVAFALLQLEDLPLVAQDAMADWIADARARAEAQSALAALSARIAGDTD